jgi:hypothetical protein
MANPDNPHGFDIYEVEGFGGNVPLRSAKIQTGVAFAKGDAVYRDASGYLALAVSTTGAKVLGVAAESAVSGTTHPELLYVPALKEITFSGQCSGTPTQATIGTDVDIEGTTGIMEINEDATVGGVARIIGLNPRSTMAAHAELLFKWATPQT